MSWFNKVSDFAGRAEDLLNKIDQNAADALKKPKGSSAGGSTVPFTRVESVSSLRNESVCSEGVLESPLKRLPIRPSYAASSSGRSLGERKKEDDELIAFLNDAGRDHGSSGRSSVASHVSAANSNIPLPHLSPYGTQGAAGKMGSFSDSSAELKAQISDALKSLHLKESQMAVMSVRLQEAEDAVTRKETKIAELLKENDALRNNPRLHSEQLSTGDLEASLERSEAERRRERESAEAREMELVKRLERAGEEKSALLNEVQSLRTAATELELRSKQHNEEMRLAKYNLEANKHEFDEYKQKAQKILNAKEQLLASLKQNNADGSGGGANSVELEELRCERELLKEDLQQSQLVIYNLKADIQDMENRLREEQKSSCAQREALLEQNHRHLSAANQFREQMERTQLEYEFLQAEMRRQEEAVERKLAEKDVELMKLMEERKSSRKYEAGEAEQRITLMGEKLIAKQTAIERLEGEKRALTLRLERSERAYRQAEAAAVKACAVDMRETGGGSSLQRLPPFLEVSSTDSSSLRVIKSVVGLIDILGLRLANFMRSPVFRLFFLIYCVLLHAWVFFVLLTYTPEIHPL